MGSAAPSAAGPVAGRDYPRNFRQFVEWSRPRDYDTIVYSRRGDRGKVRGPAPKSRMVR